MSRKRESICMIRCLRREGKDLSRVIWNGPYCLVHYATRPAIDARAGCMVVPLLLLLPTRFEPQNGMSSGIRNKTKLRRRTMCTAHDL